MTNINLLIVSLVCASFVIVNGNLPETIPVCSRNHPNLSECVSNAFQTLRPRIATGDLGPGIKAPSLEPLHIPHLQIGEDKSLKVLLTNVKIHGASKYNIDKLRANYNNLKFDVLLTVPKLRIYGKYKLSFNFLNQLVKSDGDYYAEFENPRVRATLKGHRYINNGLEYAQIDPIDIKFQRGIVKEVKLSNLFPENPVIGEVINAMLNADPDFALKSIYPQINSYLSKFATEVAKKIIEGNPLDELFPK